MDAPPDLLVRDALARTFAAACAGDVDAEGAVAELANWARGEPGRALLQRIRTAEEEPIFTAGGSLERGLGALGGYIRDRAERFTAALTWIREDGGIGDPLACARAAWDAGLFFEVQEILEPAWVRERGDRRELLQGLIMAGAALHHLVQGNLVGARGLLQDAADRLAGSYPEEPLDLERFAAELGKLGDRIETGAVRDPGDLEEIPTLQTR